MPTVLTGRDGPWPLDPEFHLPADITAKIDNHGVSGLFLFSRAPHLTLRRDHVGRGRPEMKIRLAAVEP